MLTKEQIKWMADHYRRDVATGITTNADQHFTAGAKWANYQNAAEIDRLEAEKAELLDALRNVLNTGLNGGNNIRLSLIAASGKPLTADLLEKADASEVATNKAFELIEKYKK